MGHLFVDQLDEFLDDCVPRRNEVSALKMLKYLDEYKNIVVCMARYMATTIYSARQIPFPECISGSMEYLIRYKYKMKEFRKQFIIFVKNVRDILHYIIAVIGMIRAHLKSKELDSAYLVRFEHTKKMANFAKDLLKNVCKMRSDPDNGLQLAEEMIKDWQRDGLFPEQNEPEDKKVVRTRIFADNVFFALKNIKTIEMCK